MPNVAEKQEKNEKKNKEKKTKKSKNLPATISAPTTALRGAPQHRFALLNPVFLQKIFPYAADKMESAGTFKSVSSSWVETIVKYSGGLLCLKVYLECGEQENQGRLLPRTEDFHHTLPIALKTLLSALHNVSHCRHFHEWIIDALFDVCDLLGLRILDKHRQDEQMLSLSQFAFYRSVFRRLVLLPNAPCATAIRLFKKTMRLFGDRYDADEDDEHAKSKMENMRRLTMKINDDDTDNNNNNNLSFLRNILSDCDLLQHAASRHDGDSDEFPQFLVSTFRRVGGEEFLRNELFDFSPDFDTESVLHASISHGNLDSLSFFVDTILATTYGCGSGADRFLKLCRRLHHHFSVFASASLWESRLELPEQSAAQENLFACIKYLIEKIRAFGGNDEVKKHLVLQWRCETHFKSQNRSNKKNGYFCHQCRYDSDLHVELSGEELPLSSFGCVGRCSIHTACEFGSLEMLQNVIDLAKGLDDEEFFKSLLCIRGCRSAPSQLYDRTVYSPLYYVLLKQNNGDDNSKNALKRNCKAKVNLLVDQLLLFGKEFLLRQAEEIEDKVTICSEELDPESVDYYLELLENTRSSSLNT